MYDDYYTKIKAIIDDDYITTSIKIYRRKILMNYDEYIESILKFLIFNEFKLARDKYLHNIQLLLDILNRVKSDLFKYYTEVFNSKRHYIGSVNVACRLEGPLFYDKRCRTWRYFLIFNEDFDYTCFPFMENETYSETEDCDVYPYMYMYTDEKYTAQDLLYMNDDNEFNRIMDNVLLNPDFEEESNFEFEDFKAKREEIKQRKLQAIEVLRPILLEYMLRPPLREGDAGGILYRRALKNFNKNFNKLAEQINQ